ncbi:Ag5r.2 family protein [Megaselia abdita]
MATMQWDDDLAYMARLTVKKCDYGSNYCINTNKYRISGQNWAKHYWYGFSETISSLLESQMTSWFDKYKLSNMNFINNMSSVQNGPYTFTVMVHQLSTRIGCAAVRYSEVNNGINWSTLTTACSYAHNNVLGHKVYVSGPVASKCVTGRNKDFLNLCSVDEVYDVNIPL